jgi:hypothetical protein
MHEPQSSLQAAENLALFEGYGLQAVHNYCVMNPALAAEGCYSSRTHPFSAACLAAEVRFFVRVSEISPIGMLRTIGKDVPQGLKPDVFSAIYGPTKVVP